MTSLLSPSVPGLCSVLGTISLSQVADTPRTLNHPDIRAQIPLNIDYFPPNPERYALKIGETATR
jgi:hypothetical protein